MKKLYFFLIFLLALTFTPKTSAQEIADTKSSRSGKIAVIEEGEVINRNFFITGERVEVSGTVNGDLYAAGGQIYIDGNINGDLLVAGGMVNISGNVTQDIRAAGGQLVFSGTVGNNLTIVGGNIDIAGPALVNGSVVAAGGNLTVSAPITGNLNAGAGNITIASVINGDVEAGFGNAILTSKAEVRGDFDYWSEQEISLADEEQIKGKVSKNDIKSAFEQFETKNIKVPRTQLLEAKQKTQTVFQIIGFLSILLVGLLLIHLFPKYFMSTSDVLKKKPLFSLGVGFLLLILTPFVILFSLITVIGIPIGLILMAFYAIYIYLSKLVIMIWLGDFLTKRFQRKDSPAVIFITGLIVYSLIMIIPLPVIAGVVRFFTTLFGLGVLAITCQKTYLASRKKNIV